MTPFLHSQSYGQPTAQPALLIVHGLFGSARNWRSIAKRLSADRKVITVDVRNHGDSFWHPSHKYTDLANDLENTLSQIPGPVDLLGHSMGGKAAMALALRNPQNLNRLIVADIAPIPYSHSQIANIDVMQSIDISSFTRRSEVDQVMKNRIADGATRAFLLQSLEISETGNRWKLNLDALANNMDDIIGFPNISETFSNATLFLKGALSDYVADEYIPTIKIRFPNAVIQEIPAAGHWVHAEAPREFIKAVIGFLSPTA